MLKLKQINSLFKITNKLLNILNSSIKQLSQISKKNINNNTIQIKITYKTNQHIRQIILIKITKMDQQIFDYHKLRIQQNHPNKIKFMFNNHHFQNLNNPLILFTSKIINLVI